MNEPGIPTQVFFPPLQDDNNNNHNNNNHNNTTTAHVPNDSIIFDHHMSPSLSPSTSSSYLWSNVDTLSMPETSTPPSWSTPKGPADGTSFAIASNATPLLDAAAGSSNNNNNNNNSITQRSTSSSAPPEDTSVFNISWGGGQDRPPLELHHDETTTLPTTPSKPLPKPRGIRRLPEPEPSEDGTIDEDTLKRRKNTSAARKSRMKKLMHIEHLEHQIQQLQTENSQLVLNNALVESEKKSLLAKEQEYKKRIKYLEEIVRMSCDHVLDESTQI